MENMIALSHSLVKSLGPEIGKEARQLLSTMKSQPSHATNTFKCSLAPSFGDLKYAEYEYMDKQLTTIIAVTTKMIGELSDEKRTWKGVVAALQQNPVLEAMGDEVFREDKIAIKKFSLLPKNGKPDKTDLMTVRTWFNSLVSDEDVLEATEIDIGWCEQLVCQMGSRVRNILEVVGKSERFDTNLVDIGVLRYPNLTNPYFKVFRIHLYLWTDTTRILNFQSDDNGIVGEFRCRKYKPCEKVIENLPKNIIQSGVNLTRAILGSISDSDDDDDDDE